MKRIVYTISISVLLFLTNILNTHAQGVTVNGDSHGIYFVGNTYSNLNGSPYIYEDWVKGSVKLVNGTIYNDLFLKYDQIKDELIFLNEAKTPQTFSQSVKEFAIADLNQGGDVKRTFLSGFSSMENTNPKTFYELLTVGDTELIKHISKKIVEERGNGSILVTKQVQETTKYYLAKSNRLTSIKKDKKSVFTALKNKAGELDLYITSNNLNLKKEADLIKLINYYNTL